MFVSISKVLIKRQFFQMADAINTIKDGHSYLFWSLKMSDFGIVKPDVVEPK